MRNVIKSEVQNCPMELQIFRGHFSSPRILSFLLYGLAKKKKYHPHQFFSCSYRREDRKIGIQLLCICSAFAIFFLRENPSLFQNFCEQTRAGFFQFCVRYNLSENSVFLQRKYMVKMRGLSILEQNIFRTVFHSYLG